MLKSPEIYNYINSAWSTAGIHWPLTSPGSSVNSYMYLTYQGGSISLNSNFTNVAQGLANTGYNSHLSITGNTLSYGNITDSYSTYDINNHDNYTYNGFLQPNFIMLPNGNLFVVTYTRNPITLAKGTNNAFQNIWGQNNTTSVCIDSEWLDGEGYVCFQSQIQNQSFIPYQTVTLNCLNVSGFNCTNDSNSQIDFNRGVSNSLHITDGDDNYIISTQYVNDTNINVTYSMNNSFTQLGNYTYSISKNSGNSSIMLTRCDSNYSNCDGGTAISNSFTVSPDSLKVMGTSGYRSDLIVQYQDYSSGSTYAKVLWNDSSTNVASMAMLNADGYTYYAVKDSGNAYIYIYKCSGNACSSVLVVNGRTDNNASIQLALSGSDVVMTFDVYGGSSPVTFVGGDINNQQ